MKLHGIFVEYILYRNVSNLDEIIPQIANKIANLEKETVPVWSEQRANFM